MLSRILCLIQLHDWRPARDGLESKDLPGGGWSFRVVTVECQRCKKRKAVG